MAVKNWLIRTTQNQILGPVSKQKIIDLIRSGKLEEDDEVCSGNGYWFYIKEDDLVDKYLVGDIPQGFNPVYEMEPILTRKVKKDQTSTLGGAANFHAGAGSAGANDPNNILPDDDDLEYPDIEINIDEDDDDMDDITMIGQVGAGGVASTGISLDELQGQAEPVVSQPIIPNKNINLMGRKETIKDEEASRPGKIPEAEDLEYPDLGIEQSLIDQKLQDPTGEIEIPDMGLSETQKVNSNSEPVEIFDEVDPFEEDEVSDIGIPNEPSDPSVPRKVKKKAKKKSTGSVKEATSKKKTSKSKSKKTKKSEFSKSNDDDIDSALDRNTDRRGHGRGRRRGVDTYLILIFGSVIIIIVAIIFYYKKVLKKPLPFFSLDSISIISDLHAQDNFLDIKKKK